MTSTLDTQKTKPNQIKTLLSGLSLILRPTPPNNRAVPLPDWLPEDTPFPYWVPLVAKHGLVKVMPVLQDATQYPALLQGICQSLGTSSIIEWQNRHYEVTGVETETDSLFVIQMTLSPKKPLPASINRAIHGICTQWFTNADVNLGNAIHQMEPSPFTVSARSVSHRTIQLRIAVLQQELLSPLLWGLCADLGQEIFVMDIPCLVGSQVEIVSSSRFEKLDQVMPQDAIALEFLTPTSFKQQQSIQNFPLPECVFGSLLRRWNAFAPEKLVLPEIQWQGLVSEYELKTHAIKMKADELGAQGWIRYRFPDSEQARIATILAHFALFSGVGRKTAMGMGQAQLKRYPKR